MRRIRGNEVAMIFQDPLTALHPFYTIGQQIVEAYRLHNNVSQERSPSRAIEMLDLVGIPQPDRRVNDYPHQFSGGMRQRAMIAMSLVNNPKLLIADEPTTALDVTVQAQILDLIQDLQREFGSAVVLITHDLGVIAEIADDVLVMYAGRCVEKGARKQILTHPEMPYTWGLLGSIADVAGDAEAAASRSRARRRACSTRRPAAPSIRVAAYREYVEGNRCVTELPELRQGRLPGPPTRCHLQRPGAVFDAEVKQVVLPRDCRRTSDHSNRSHGGPPLLEVTDLVKHFPVKSGGVIRRTIGQVQAVDGISFTLQRGQIARPRGGVRLRQDHHRAPDHPAATSPTVGLDEVRGPRASPHCPASRCCPTGARSS